MKHWLFWSACCLLPAAAAAGQAPEGGYWLQRMVGAAHKLDYEGIFVFQNAASAETSRIVHLVEAGREMERIEVLDQDEHCAVSDASNHVLTERV